ncbi:Cell wall-associated hydrolase, NlpC family [Propionibacterium cyclohexanicum]|uniref:Cell wall-associated hydrolase, NlpC family n=1 Tax=Propionibacterium cyclohexanicum TaxID=64702 RepID=A0A1H9U6I7_9ACTN|nr:C40 family peptidase [Propionibacterium cyclohexanicum]SES04932.1 Cell wall-associated hydrolase, NlpC family [Propionibacterium cyclohexanicum]
MPAKRALLEESADSIIEITAPRRAQISGISQVAVLGTDHCTPRRAYVALDTAATRPHTKRTRLAFPAAAAFLTSALGLGISLAPQAAANQPRPVNTSVSAPSSSSVALVASLPAADDAEVLGNSAIADAATLRLESESSQQQAQAAADEQRAATLASVGKTAADKLSADAAAAADKAAAEKAAAEKAAAASSQRNAAQQAAAQQVAVAASSTATQATSAPAASTTSATAAKATTASAVASSAAQAALNYALAQVGKPYVWGAAGPNAFDCSGLTQAAYAAAGVSIPRTTYAQVGAGTPVSTSALKPGDLVFFYGNEHVGLYIGDGKVVHAADVGIGVVISNMSSMATSGAVRVG